jgi:hypothetical protein
MSASAPPRGLGPYATLAITVAWLVLLAAVTYLYIENDRTIMGIKNPPNGVLTIAWLGSLGALIASFSDLARKADRWNPNLAIWFGIRPLTGAAFGAIGYLIYHELAQISVADGPQGPETPTILGYVVAFTLGYREELFRELLKRVTDLLATAGGADVEPPSAPPGLTYKVGGPESHDVTISWDPSSDNVAVAGYNVYRNRRFLASVLVRQADRNDSTTQQQDDDASDGRRDPERISFVDYTLKDSEFYLYSVTAIDGAQNESAPAGPIRVRLSPAEDH